MNIPEKDIKEMNGEEIEALIKSLYIKAKNIEPDTALKMALEAENHEEKKFFTYIAYMNLENYPEEQTERAFCGRMLRIIKKMEEAK